MNLRKLFKNKKGQAVFEFILFLPFMLMVYTVVVTICNAINGSINQQKAARGYLFARIKNNSNVPQVSNLNGFDGVKTAGMVTIAWRETSMEGDKPVAPCYKINSIFTSSTNQGCLDRPSDKTTTQFIRVKTAFGICGTTYNIEGSDDFSRSATQASPSSCLLLSESMGPLRAY